MTPVADPRLAELTEALHRWATAHGGCVHFDKGYGPYAQCEDPDESWPKYAILDIWPARTATPAADPRLAELTEALTRRWHLPRATPADEAAAILALLPARTATTEAPESEATPMGSRDWPTVLAWWQARFIEQGSRAERAEDDADRLADALGAADLALMGDPVHAPNAGGSVHRRVIDALAAHAALCAPPGPPSATTEAVARSEDWFYGLDWRYICDEASKAGEDRATFNAAVARILVAAREDVG